VRYIYRIIVDQSAVTIRGAPIRHWLIIGQPIINA